MKTSTGFLSSRLLVFNGFAEKLDDQQLTDVSSLSIRLITYYCSTNIRLKKNGCRSFIKLVHHHKHKRHTAEVKSAVMINKFKLKIHDLDSDPISERLTDSRLMEHQTLCETTSVCLVSDDGTKFPSHFLHLFARFEKLRFVAETEK